MGSASGLGTRGHRQDARRERVQQPITAASRILTLVSVASATELPKGISNAKVSASATSKANASLSRKTDSIVLCLVMATYYSLQDLAIAYKMDSSIYLTSAFARLDFKERFIVSDFGDKLALYAVADGV